MERTATPSATRDELRARFAAEIDGGRPTGLRAFRDEHGTLGLVHQWTTVVAKPPV